jgi:hypothetical protein
MEKFDRKLWLVKQVQDVGGNKMKGNVAGQGCVNRLIVKSL